ncbi:hypothetical protein [Thalassoroseus pseudoceratinae]|uniref:hypothetical protein n=1 Tax=Thalassoroseus pseudoceratinae TaxID=2713176 RepID=UPI0014242969|nr:hypothetical protein [Thalassoroseus pseudoceratinae]
MRITLGDSYGRESWERSHSVPSSVSVPVYADRAIIHGLIGDRARYPACFDHAEFVGPFVFADYVGAEVVCRIDP